ncbi:hypothetical protein M0802_014361 [Mischocyttarus mexicanus]|nr:hypothetical protein M0802_014361 [Mischocyttarus mexicanus]
MLPSPRNTWQSSYYYNSDNNYAYYRTTAINLENANKTVKPARTLKFVPRSSSTRNFSPQRKVIPRTIRLTEYQEAVLEDQFKRWPRAPHTGDIVLLAAETGLSEDDVQTMSLSIGNTLEIINVIDDLNELTESAVVCIAFYLSLLRITIYSLHREDISYIIETMRNDWIVASYEDILILKDKCLFTFRLSKLFIFSVASTILIFICAPLIEGFIFNTNIRILPFRGYYIVNHTISPIFEILYTYNVISGCFSATTIAGATTFNLVIIMHGSAKFAILQKRLQNIKGNDREAYAELSECVKSHQDAITYSGNKLIDESEAVGYAAYESEWYHNNMGRTLQTIIQRCRIPCKITAAKFYNMSLESFAKVLSTSFSYLTVLQASNEE